MRHQQFSDEHPHIQDVAAYVGAYVQEERGTVRYAPQPPLRSG